MNRVKRPRVKIFTGSVKSKIIGRIRAFINPKTITVMASDQLLENVIPGTISETKSKQSAFKIHRNSQYMFLSPNKLLILNSGTRPKYQDTRNKIQSSNNIQISNHKFQIIEN